MSLGHETWKLCNISIDSMKVHFKKSNYLHIPNVRNVELLFRSVMFANTNLYKFDYRKTCDTSRTLVGNKIIWGKLMRKIHRARPKCLETPNFTRFTKSK